MNLSLHDLENGEWILIHDFYQESPEPDAPLKKIIELSVEEQELAAQNYSSENYKTIKHNETIIGFVGFFPDDANNINLFSVISPKHRGQGHFAKILTLAVNYCRAQYPEYKFIRSLTRKENTAAINGLEKFSFIRKGEVIEEVQPDITYQEYLLPI